VSEFPRRWGRYEILSELGRGGWGRVYRADLLGPAGFRKPVALKVAAGDGASGELVEALLDEARVGALLHHPAVVGVFDVGVIDGEFFVAMELVDGLSAAELSARSGPLPLPMVVRVGLEISEALAHAHALGAGPGRAGLVHGDVKPANILLGRDGRARLADFGLARVAGLTRSRESRPTAGSIGYLAPECLDGATPDGRADLFSLGVVLAELATGAPVFPRQGFAQYAFALVAPTTVPALADLDPALAPIVRGCLERSPEDRFGDAAAVEAALGSCGVSPAPRRALAELVAGAADAPAEPLADVPTTADLRSPEGRGPFLGRQEEVARIADLVRARPLVTLTGPGGVGKTRTAPRAAGATAGREPPLQVVFCDLAAVTDRVGIVRVVAAALGVAGKTGDEEAQLAAALGRADDALLILDNAEQVLQPLGEALERWLPGARARFLVTSREQLHVPGEAVVPLGPLDPPTAARLYRERASVPASPADVDALVVALDGLPLAIEMAAAMAPVSSPPDLLARLAGDPGWLRSVRSDRPDRHRSIDATLRWSWELLSPWERAALAQLSVFRRGFTIEGAEAVLDLDAWPEAPWTMFVVEALLDRSLVRPTSHRGPPRFALYAVVREWVSARHDPTDRDATRRRHAEYFAEFGRRGAALEARTMAGRGLHRRLLDELADLDAAFAIALETVPECVVPLGVAVALACGIEGPYGQGIEAVQRALEEVSDDAGRLRLLQRFAFLMVRAGGTEKLASVAAESRAIAARLGDRDGLARALDHEATGHTLQGRPAEAVPRLVEALAIADELGDVQLRGAITSNLAVAHYAQGNMERFGTLAAESLRLSREAGDIVGEGLALSNVGVHVAQQGDLEAAAALFREALDVQRLKGHRGDIALAELNLALVHAPDGSPLRAVEEQQRMLGDVERTLKRLGDRPLEGLARAFRGLAGLRLGAGPEHELLVEDGRRILHEAGAAPLEQMLLRDWSVHLFRTGELERATGLAQEAVAAARAQGDKLSLAELSAVLGLIAASRGDRDEGGRRLEQAEALLEVVGAAPGSPARVRVDELRARVGGL